MPRLRRLLRLFAVTVLVVTGTCAVVPNPSWAGDKPGESRPLKGFDRKELAEICDHYRGRFEDKLPEPFQYGCVVVDGHIDCTEKVECVFYRQAGLPFEETCESAGDKYLIFDKFAIFRCWNETRPIVLQCDPRWEVCAIGHDQPLP